MSMLRIHIPQRYMKQQQQPHQMGIKNSKQHINDNGSENGNGGGSPARTRRGSEGVAPGGHRLAGARCTGGRQNPGLSSDASASPQNGSGRSPRTTAPSWSGGRRRSRPWSTSTSRRSRWAPWRPRRAPRMWASWSRPFGGPGQPALPTAPAAPGASPCGRCLPSGPPWPSAPPLQGDSQQQIALAVWVLPSQLLSQPEILKKRTKTYPNFTWLLFFSREIHQRKSNTGRTKTFSSNKCKMFGLYPPHGFKYHSKENVFLSSQYWALNTYRLHALTSKILDTATRLNHAKRFSTNSFVTADSHNLQGVACQVMVTTEGPSKNKQQIVPLILPMSTIT